MQIQKLALDGLGKLTPYELAAAADQNWNDQAVAESAQDNGYVVVIGENLDDENPGNRTLRAVAVSGRLINSSLVL